MTDGAAACTRKTILMVSASEAAGERLSRWLVDAGYHVVRYKEVRRLAETISEERPDLLVLNLEAVEAVESGRLASAFAERSIRVPTLLVAASRDVVNGVALESSNIDWIDSPKDSRCLLTRVRAMLRVACDSGREEGGAKRDGLTKVYNRRYFDERIEMEIERARRYGRKVSCAMIDIDGFKDVNARHGHGAGDTVLKALADILLSSTRSSDIVARYGGEEFVVILPETAGREASISSERVRKTFEDLGLRFGPDDPAVTVSCGIATYPDHAADSATLLRMADSALLRAKSEGRNRTVVAFSESEQGFVSSGPLAAKILIVEDNDYNRCVASLVLRASGYEVLEATDGEMGISLARASHPDLVIIDLQIHGMSGLEATRQIVEMDTNRTMAVVALTANALPNDLEELARVGCRGYITKPIDTDMLASQVQVYLDE
ncbi:MAG: diguanylate cyclase [Candidatus Eisenbacteria bacterium]|nr:diguanylate cyclase [Candidatus Eisenbacteria bacterium]